MRLHSIVSVLLALVMADVPHVAAGDAPLWPPREGTRVRFTAPSLATGLVVAEVLAVEGDVVSVRTGPLGPPVQVPVEAITRFEVSRGQRSHIGKGALIGAGGVAAFLGTLAVLFCGGDCSANDVATAVGKAALAGAVAGATVGGMIHHEEWAPAAPAPKLPGAPVAERRLHPLFTVAFRF